MGGTSASGGATGVAGGGVTGLGGGVAGSTGTGGTAVSGTAGTTGVAGTTGAAGATAGTTGAAGSTTGGGGIAGGPNFGLGGGIVVGTSQCSDGKDNDGDGKIDFGDPECVGPLDNDEGSFATGIPGDNSDACKQDCFFDGNSGAGDDGCDWQLKCDPLERLPRSAPTTPTTRRSTRPNARCRRRSHSSASTSVGSADPERV